MKEDNIRTLEETLAIIDRGSYQVNGKTIALRLSKREMESVHVLLPENVQALRYRPLRVYLRQNGLLPGGLRTVSFPHIHREGYEASSGPQLC